jgi:hypothetical protein
VDITPGKDGGILKEITTQGVVGDGPLLGDKVSKYNEGDEGHSLLFLFQILYRMLMLV